MVLDITTKKKNATERLPDQMVEAPSLDQSKGTNLPLQDFDDLHRLHRLSGL